MLDSIKKRAWHYAYMKENYTSDSNTRALRTTSKMREGNINMLDGTADISQCIGLLGKEFEYDVPGELATVKKKVRIVMLYPHMALGVYKAGREGEHELKIGIPIADLVTRGFVSFAKGYAEVIG